MPKVTRQKLHWALSCFSPVLYERHLSAEFAVYVRFGEHSFSLLAKHRSIEIDNPRIYSKHCRRLSYDLVCKAACKGRLPFLGGYIIHGAYSAPVVPHEHF